MDSSAPYGTYNLSSSGEPVTWADIAKRVYELTGHDPARITAVSTEEYFANAAGPVAPRPRNSTLDISKLAAAGYHPADGDAALVGLLGGARSRANRRSSLAFDVATIATRAG